MNTFTFAVRDFFLRLLSQTRYCISLRALVLLLSSPLHSRLITGERLHFLVVFRSNYEEAFLLPDESLPVFSNVSLTFFAGRPAVNLRICLSLSLTTETGSLIVITWTRGYILLDIILNLKGVLLPLGSQEVL